MITYKFELQCRRRTSPGDWEFIKETDSYAQAKSAIRTLRDFDAATAATRYDGYDFRAVNQRTGKPLFEDVSI